MISRKLLMTGATVALCAVGTAVFAVDESVTIPATVDIGGYIDNGIIQLAKIAAAAVGGFVAWKLIRKGLVWLDSAFGGKY